jgi:hypothetical protein
MVLSETQWPTAFFGYPREHRVAAETPVHKGTHGLPSEWILTLEPSVSRTRMANRQDGSPGDGTDSLTRDAQAARCLKCLASKLAPFFQTLNVIAAIFLAKVRRAIVGFAPLVSKAS